MAHIEIHALSVKLAGTFEAHVFFPEQEVEKAEEKFPVLWMIHEDGTGTFDLMRHAALMEKIAEEKKMFVIAPMISHLAQRMKNSLWKNARKFSAFYIQSVKRKKTIIFLESIQVSMVR